MIASLIVYCSGEAKVSLCLGFAYSIVVMMMRIDRGTARRAIESGGSKEMGMMINGI